MHESNALTRKRIEEAKEDHVEPHFPWQAERPAVQPQACRSDFSSEPTGAPQLDEYHEEWHEERQHE